MPWSPPGEGAASSAITRHCAPFLFCCQKIAGMELTQVKALARRVPQFASAEEIAISFLAGGITNQNYRLIINGASFVLRVSGTNTELLGIVRSREAYNHRIAASAGIAPELIEIIMPEGYLVTRFVEGEKIASGQLRAAARIRDVCRSLHAVHDGPDFIGTFSPFRAVESYLEFARRSHAPFPSDMGELEKLANTIERALYDRETLRPRPIHSDLLSENFIDDGQVIRILDWEYSGMGDILFDLANLADHNEFSDDDEQVLLRDYFGDYTLHDHARLKLLRIMSDFREAMWGIVQSTISTLEFDFSGYANKFFERMQSQASDPRYQQWLRAAAGAD